MDEPEKVPTAIAARGPDRTADVTVVANSVGNSANEPQLCGDDEASCSRTTEMIIRITNAYMLIR